MFLECSNYRQKRFVKSQISLLFLDLAWDSKIHIKFFSTTPPPPPHPPPTPTTTTIRSNCGYKVKCMYKIIAWNPIKLICINLQDYSNLGMWHFAPLVPFKVNIITQNGQIFTFLLNISLIVAIKAFEWMDWKIIGNPIASLQWLPRNNYETLIENVTSKWQCDHCKCKKYHQALSSLFKKKLSENKSTGECEPRSYSGGNMVLSVPSHCLN